MQPLISIIIPVYNAGALLHKCINSLKNQTFQEWEAICIDDGSTDSSATTLDNIAYQDQRFRIIHQTNKGVSSARNEGISRATAPFITFVDADDSLEPEALQKLLTAMTTFDCDIACCNSRRILPNGNIKIAPSAFPAGLHRATPAQIYRFAMRSPWGKLYKTSIIKQAKLNFPTNTIIAEDDVFVVSYWSHIKSFAIIDNPLYNYVLSESSTLKKLKAGKMPYEVYARTIEVPRLIYQHVSSHISNDRELKLWSIELLKLLYHMTDWMLTCSANLPYAERLKNHARVNRKIISQHVPLLTAIFIHLKALAAQKVKAWHK